MMALAALTARLRKDKTMGDIKGDSAATAEIKRSALRAPAARVQAFSMEQVLEPK